MTLHDDGRVSGATGGKGGPLGPTTSGRTSP